MLQEQVLALLEHHRGQLITGGEIARALGVSRNAVWKTIVSLRGQGHEIESLRSSGYRLAGDSDGLSEAGIRAHLTAKRLGCHMELLKTVSSTNRYLRAQDTALLPEGYVVIADEQTQGRGRLDRPFYSPAQAGIYLSCLLKPPIPLSETPFLTLCAAVAVCSAVETVCGIRPGVKWVNDIYYEGKKLCGILTEAFVSAEMRAVEYAVVGIGVNTGEVPAEVRDTATSIYQATGRRGLRNQLAAEILNALERVYDAYTEGSGKRAILDAYTERLFILGQTVEAAGPQGSFTATVLGVNDAGGLIVRRTDGAVEHIGAGEIRLMGEST